MLRCFTARAAFKTIVDALGAMDDPIKQNEAGVNLFGTMWEDLGADAVNALGDISNSAYDCAGAMDEIKGSTTAPFRTRWADYSASWS